MSLLKLAEIVFFASIALFLFGVLTPVTSLIAGIAAVFIALILIVGDTSL